MYDKENKDPIQPPPLKRPKIEQVYECNVCGMAFETVQELQDHGNTHPKKDVSEETHHPEGANMEGALNNALKVVTFEIEGMQKVDPLQLFSD